MNKRLNGRNALVWVLALAAGSLCGVVRGQSDDAGADRITGVAAGTDYLQTAAGTFAEIIGAHFPMEGVALSTTSGTTDTVVKRLKDGTMSKGSTTVPIQLVALSMKGTVGHCTVTVSLTPSPASTGTMTITRTSATGGTFTSNIDVMYSADFTPAVTCPPHFSDHYPMTQTGGKWQTTPVSGEYLVTGAYPDPEANQHSGLPAGVVDFFIVGNGRENSKTARHIVCEAQTQAGTTCQ